MIFSWPEHQPVDLAERRKLQLKFYLATLVNLAVSTALLAARHPDPSKVEPPIADDLALRAHGVARSAPFERLDRIGAEFQDLLDPPGVDAGIRALVDHALHTERNRAAPGGSRMRSARLVRVRARARRGRARARACPVPCGLSSRRATRRRAIIALARNRATQLGRPFFLSLYSPSPPRYSQPPLLGDAEAFQRQMTLISS